MSRLVIQGDKFYKTRDGQKARIYSMDGWSSQAIHGAIQDKHTSLWNVTSWYADGKMDPVSEVRGDLVSEWVEPEPKKPRMLAYLVNNVYGSTCSAGFDLRYYPEGMTVTISDYTIRAPWLDEPESK